MYVGRCVAAIGARGSMSSDRSRIDGSLESGTVDIEEY